jgi:hypothetical protein
MSPPVNPRPPETPRGQSARSRKEICPMTPPPKKTLAGTTAATTVTLQNVLNAVEGREVLSAT